MSKDLLMLEKKIKHYQNYEVVKGNFEWLLNTFLIDIKDEYATKTSIIEKRVYLEQFAWEYSYRLLFSNSERPKITSDVIKLENKLFNIIYNKCYKMLENYVNLGV